MHLTEKKKLIDEQQLSFEGSLRIHIVVWHRTAEDSCMKRMPKFACQETCNDFTAQKMNWNGYD